MNKKDKARVSKEFNKIWEVIYTYDRDTAKGYNPYRKCTEKVLSFLFTQIEGAEKRLVKRIKNIDLPPTRLGEAIRDELNQKLEEIENE